MTSEKLRKMFLDFFHKNGHVIIPSASVIPENDPTVLFTTAGMHPLVPYLMGQKHPAGGRLADCQKCIRTQDLEEVGDNTHLTFFEMLGNWSLGTYFKAEAIEYTFKFLTSKDYLGLPVSRLAFSVFAGDDTAPRDAEAAAYWRSHGVPSDKIFYLPKKNNWWHAGETGPCGPDTEVFIDTGVKPCGKGCSPACDCGKYVEIWNNVFMEYYKDANGYRPLSQKNVDTGMGLERVVYLLSGKGSVYETDLFHGAIAKIEELSGKKYSDGGDITKAFRIIADHARTATFILGDPHGVSPSNTDQGYVLRRLIRRAVRWGRTLSLPPHSIVTLSRIYIEKYRDVYPELEKNKDKIISELQAEEERFGKTLAQGLKEFERLRAELKKAGKTEVDGKAAFHLYDTCGFPFEMTEELCSEHGLTVDKKGYEEAFKAHQALSQTGAEAKFKGGLADGGEQTARLHTATHLLQAALRKVLGSGVAQKGSNITPERLRFDFSFERAMTEEEIAKTEKLVNEAIEAGAAIECFETTVDDAKARGAIGLFADKYGEKVKVYKMGDFSMEICGGPHANNTKELGRFTIAKEQSSGAGVRRIRGELCRK